MIRNRFIEKFTALLIAAVMVFALIPAVFADSLFMNIQSIEVNDITLIENIGCQDGYYYYSPTFTVTMKNGDVYESDPDGWVQIDDTAFYLSVEDDQSYDNLWTAGNTYKATASFMEFSDEFNVTVAESPFASLEIDDIDLAYQIDGYDAGGSFWYNFSSTEYTLTFKDGSTVCKDLDRGFEYNGTTYYARYRCEDGYDDWQLGESYEITVELVGLKGTYTAKVVKSDIESLEIDDLEIIENCNTYEDDGFIHYNYYPKFRLTDINQNVYSNNDYYDINVNGKSLWLNISDTQSKDTPWTAGNTYQATGTVAGLSDTFNVKIVETPVDHIECGNVEVIENTKGDEREGYYYYYNIEPSLVTVHLKNGESILVEYGNSFEYNGDRYAIEIKTKQNITKHFELGNTYKIEASVLGYDFDYDLTVIDSPIAALEIEDIEICENTCGYWSGSEYRYQYFHPDYKVVFRDGTEISKENAESLPYQGIYYNMDFQVSAEEWKAGGTYTVNASILGKTAQFKVTVTETPIKSIEVNDARIAENTSGYYSGGKFIYDYYSLSFTVNFKDGSSKDYYNETSILYKGERYYLDYDISSQFNEPWIAGNSYPASISLMGVSATFNVEITKIVVDRIAVNDISIVEDESCDETEGFKKYYYNPHLTVYFQDGTELEGYGGVEYYGRYFSLDTSDTQSKDTPWTVGNAYTVSAAIFGVSTAFNVSIVSSPVVSIEAKDIILVENTHGGNHSGFYEYYDYEPDITVHFTDGSTYNTKGSRGLIINGEWHSIDFISEQNIDNPWKAGNSYKITASLFGKECDFYVTIIESPITSLEVKDISFIEGANIDDWTGFYNYSPEYTISFKDGSVKTYTYGFEYLGAYYYLDITDDQSEDNVWTAGNTYDATGSIFGLSDDFKVTIEKTPVKSVEFSDVYIEKNTHGYYDESGNFRYSNYFPKVTVTLDDGTVIEGEGGISLNGQWYGITFSAPEQPWEEGKTYTAYASMFGFSKNYDIHIISSLFTSLEIKDRTVIEGTNGYWNGDFYEYNPRASFSVTTIDGSVLESDAYGSLYYNRNYYELRIESEQTEEFLPGHTYKLTGSVGALTDDFNLTIVESPVKSISVKSSPLVKNSNGYFNGDHFIYYPYVSGLDITMKDGSVVHSEGSYLELGDDFYSADIITDQDDNAWTVGNTYEAELRLLGVTAKFNVEIIETPVKKISIINDLYEGIDYLETSGSINVSSCVFKVEFKDGNVITSNESYFQFEYKDQYYYTNDNYLYLIGDYHGVGKYNVKVEICGYEDDVEINVIENPYESFTVDNTNNQCKLIFTLKKGGTEEHKMLAFEGGVYSGTAQGSLMTDKRIFSNVKFIYEYNEMSGAEKAWNVSSISIGEMKKDISLNDFYWLQMIKNNVYRIAYIQSHIQKDFKGFDLANKLYDVDLMLALATNYGAIYAQSYEDFDSYTLYKYSADDVKEALKDYFGVDDVDLTKSRYYDPEDPDTVIVRDEMMGLGECFVRAEYEDGLWAVSISDFCKVYMDNEYYVKKVVLSMSYGDATGDSTVDMNDIVLLRQYIANYDYDTETSTVQVNSGADANGDGKVDMNDIVLLRQYIANYDYDTGTSTIHLGPA